jgi:outer membrane protein assembly factor BamB
MAASGLQLSPSGLALDAAVGQLYAQTASGGVLAYDMAAGGSPLWSYGGTASTTRYEMFVYTAPLVGPNSVIYIAGTSTQLARQLAALDVDGSELWATPLTPYGEPSVLTSSPSLSADGNTVYVGSGNSLLALTAADGTVEWSAAVGSPLTSAPAVAADGTIFSATLGGDVVAVSPAGPLMWHYDVG